MPAVSHRLLTEEQAAERIGWSAAWLRARRAQQAKHPRKYADQVPPWLVVQRQIRYRPEDVKAWLNRHREVRDADRLLEEGLAPEEVAEVLQISPRTLRIWRTERRKAEEAGDEQAAELASPPWRKVGRHIRYDQRQLDRWIQRRAKRRKGATAQKRTQGQDRA